MTDSNDERVPAPHYYDEVQLARGSASVSGFGGDAVLISFRAAGMASSVHLTINDLHLIVGLLNVVPDPRETRGSEDSYDAAAGRYEEANLHGPDY